MADDAQQPLQVVEDHDTGHRFVVYTAKDGIRLELRFDGDEPWFTPYELRSFSHAAPCDRAGLRDLITSRSYVLTATEAHRSVVSGALDRLLDSHPGLAGRERFSLPYVTDAYRAIKR